MVVVIMIDRYPGWKRVIQYRGKRGGGGIQVLPWLVILIVRRSSFLIITEDGPVTGNHLVVLLLLHS